MDAIAALMGGFAVALTPTNLALAFLGCLIGTAIGVLPGIGPMNAIALLLPFCFALKLPAESALILLAAVYYGSGYGGRITAILLNMPGEPAAAITTLDGHPLAKQGRGAAALAVSGIGSFVGATLSVVLMTFLSVPLARIAVGFSPADYVALIVFALSLLGAVAPGNAAKAWAAGCFGILLALVGIDSGTGVERLTFGSIELLGGVDFTVLAIGLFAIGEVLLLLERQMRASAASLGHGAHLSFRELVACIPAMFRATGIGFVVGVLPGAGASVAAALSYTTEKRIADKQGTFGKGDLRGVASPETADNAAQIGNLVPMLSLGIPGSGTTAVLLGALLMYSITPGPLLFTQRPEVAWGLIASMYVGNVMLLVLNLPLVGIFARLLTVPPWVLYPGVIALSFAGVYAVSNSPFDLLLATGFGVLGYVLRKLDVPLVPIILGFVLGRLLEDNLRRALSLSDGDVMALFASVPSLLLWTCTLAALVFPFLRRRA
ncbi:tripartite tricarboxylate transporter permease [Falsiroseomonas oryziterrae]|uniref:tripartite tricarboxylate transporter permease n=1 Tax=Falsiroseomonas oryziterrae TaxID=2911368 RepID=UPI001F41A1F5|nr:tripartite tricarboxylate transporter permease [Roseomonas sp. NPKOSM-4]